MMLTDKLPHLAVHTLLPCQKIGTLTRERKSEAGMRVKESLVCGKVKVGEESERQKVKLCDSYMLRAAAASSFLTPSPHTLPVMAL